MHFEEAYELLGLETSSSEESRQNLYLKSMEQLERKAEQAQHERIQYLMQGSIERLQEAHQLVEVHQVAHYPPLPSLAEAVEHATDQTSRSPEITESITTTTDPIVDETIQQQCPPPIPTQGPKHAIFAEKMKTWKEPEFTDEAEVVEATDDIETLSHEAETSHLMKELAEAQETPQLDKEREDFHQILEAPLAAEQHDDEPEYGTKTQAPISRNKQVQIPWERIFGAWAPVWIGGLIIAIGGIFLAQYMYVNAFLPLELRLSAAGLFGAALIVVGTILHRRMGAFCQALTIPGLATCYATIWGVVYFFSDSAPWLVWLSIALMIGVTLLSVCLSIQQGPYVAIFSLLSGFISPALIGHTDPHPMAMFAYLAIIQYGMTHLALTKRWHWLHMLTSIGCLLWAAIWAFAYKDGAYIEWAGAFTLISTIGSLLTTSFFGRHTDCNDPTREAAVRTQDQFLLHLLSMITLLMLGSFVIYSGGSALTWIYFFGFCTASYVFAISKSLLSGLAAYIPVISTLGMFIGLANDHFTLDHSFASGMIEYVIYGSHLVIFGLLPLLLSLNQKQKKAWSYSGLAISTIFILTLPFDLMTPFSYHPLIAASLTLFIAGWHIALSLPTDLRRFHIQQDWLNPSLRQVQLHAGYFFAILGCLMMIELDHLLMAIAHGSEVKTRFIMMGVPFAIMALSVFTAMSNGFSQRLSFKHFLNEINVLLHAFIATMQLGTIIWLFNVDNSSIENILILGFAFIPTLGSLIWTSWKCYDADLAALSVTPGAYYIFLSTITFMTLSYLLILGLMNGFSNYSSLMPLDHFLSLRFNVLLWLACALVIYLSGRRWNIPLYHQLVGIFKASCFLALIPMTLAYFTQFSNNITLSVWPHWCSVLIDLLIPCAFSTLFVYLLRTESNQAWITIRRIHQVYATVLSLLGLTLILHLSFNQGMISFTQMPLDAELYGYTILWSLYAIAILTIGILTDSLFARWSSLAILLVTITKLLLLDTHELEGLYRIFAFIGTGLLLVGIGYIYHRFVFKGQVFVNRKWLQSKIESTRKVETEDTSTSSMRD